MIIQEQTALLVVDMQYDFVSPTGRLSVPQAEKIVPLINQIATRFDNVILTQDWHPQHHVSFRENHAIQPNDTTTQIQLSYGWQQLWPSHCVQGTQGAELVADLKIDHSQLIIRKGYRPQVDSYSAFLEADGQPTGLEAYLRQRGIETVYVVGVATDFCVAWTALDAKKMGFCTYVIEDACCAIDIHQSLAQAWERMHQQGIKRITSTSIVLSS